jgi:predicted ATP-grasp superfamily ATP-dependent carboligase
MNQSSVDIAEKRSTPSASTEHFIAIIKKIGDLIRSDYGAALKTIEILKEMVGGTDLEEDVKQLARAIEEFDEDNTKIVLERLGRKTNVALSIGEI